MDAIIDILGGGALGGIVGAIASIFKSAQERKQKAIEMDHEHRMAELGLRESSQQFSHEVQMADKGIQRAEAEGAIERDIAETGAFKESLTQGLKNTGIVIVDAIRGLMRPIITVYVLGLATYIALNISMLVGGFSALEQDFVMGLYKQIIDDIMFLTMAAVLWWFGSRPSRNR